MAPSDPYLQRYLSGECERVWDELMGLGAAVRDEPTYSQALAVARKTMRRARHNIETLISTLTGLEYAFGYGLLTDDERTFARGQPAIFSLPGLDAADRIEELEALVGPLPPSLRAWYETVGTVNFVGVGPQRWHLDERAEPHYVYPIETALAEYTEWHEAHMAWAGGDANSNDPGSFRVPIAPDDLHKFNISGGVRYHIVLPNSAADALLEAESHGTMYVGYLGECFRWGGLPGWARLDNRPEDDIAFLTADLLPL